MKIYPEVESIFGKVDFDPDALHAKYLHERDKRLEGGVRDYIEVKAEFSRYVDDPYVEPGFTRTPVFDEVEFAVIGGGFGGLLMAARLREIGFKRLRSTTRHWLKRHLGALVALLDAGHLGAQLDVDALLAEHALELL